MHAHIVYNDKKHFSPPALRGSFAGRGAKSGIIMKGERIWL